MKKRELGFYWVRYDNKWFVAEYTDTHIENYNWFIPGNECEVDDNWFEEIDENRLIHG